MTRRQLPEQNAEQLEIRVTASRPIQQVSHPALAWAWFGLAPLAAWHAMWTALLPGIAPTITAPPRRAASGSRPASITGASAPNVKPFPGPDRR